MEFKFLLFNILLCILLALPVSISAQTSILDSITHEPVSFASLYDKLDPRLGTSANIDGFIDFQPAMAGHRIRITSVGYKAIDTIYGQNLSIIYLSKENKELDEVVIKANDDPAISILKKVLAHKSLNSPDNIPFYQCIAYLKTKVSLNGTEDSVQVTIGSDTMLMPRVILISESVVKKEYERYNKSYEKVLISSFSGLKEPRFAIAANDFQDMDPYDQVIRLYGREYVNPVSNLSWFKYKFNLSRKYSEGKDSIFVIDFWPRTKAGNAFKGFLIISSDNWGIQKIRLETLSEDLYPVIIHQENSKKSGRWFPDKLISEVKFPFPIPVKNNVKFLLNVTATFSDIKFDSVRVSPLKANTIDISKSPNLFDRSRLDSFRTAPLEKIEQNAYDNADQLLLSSPISYLLKNVEYLLKLQVPIGYINLRTDKILHINNYEGIRYGLGLITNRKLSDFWDIGGYVNYGTLDERWKFGAEASVYFNKLHSDFFRLSYSDDLNTIPLFNFRNRFYNKYYNKYYARERKWQGLVNISKNPFILTMALSTSEINPFYNYQFKPLSRERNTYQDDQVSFNLIYTRSKQYNFFNTYFLIRDIIYPIIDVNFTLGTDLLGNGMFKYKSLTFNFNQYLNQKFLGKTLMTLEIGKIWGHPPLFRLFNSPGSRTEKLTLLVPNSFQTMTPNIYWSSKYLNVFLTHTFNRFYTLKFSRPSLFLAGNAGWGKLDHVTDHKNITLKDYSNGYFEVGAGFEDFLRISIKDIVGVGLNIGAFYPIHTESNHFNKDLVVYKLGFAFSY